MLFHMPCNAIPAFLPIYCLTSFANFSVLIEVSDMTNLALLFNFLALRTILFHTGRLYEVSMRGVTRGFRGFLLFQKKMRRVDGLGYSRNVSFSGRNFSISLKK